MLHKNLNIDVKTSIREKDLCKGNELIGYAQINDQKIYELKIESIIETVGYS